ATAEIRMSHETQNPRHSFSVRRFMPEDPRCCRHHDFEEPEQREIHPRDLNQAIRNKVAWVIIEVLPRFHELFEALTGYQAPAKLLTRDLDRRLVVAPIPERADHLGSDCTQTTLLTIIERMT